MEERLSSEQCTVGYACPGLWSPPDSAAAEYHCFWCVQLVRRLTVELCRQAL